MAHAAGQPPLLGGGRLICIDGPAGAGKTTFSNSLEMLATQQGIDVRLVHLDDMYDGWRQALSSIGPRLRNYLIGPLASGHRGRYHRYDWHAGRFAEWVTVPRSDLLIVEGVGAGHPNIASRRATLVWVDADPAVCLARGIKRDGEDMRDHWLAWKVLETAYIDHFSVAEKADLTVVTTNVR